MKLSKLIIVKKIKQLLFFLLFIPILLNGQSITSDWFYQDGNKIERIRAESPEQFNIPEEGVDKVWDFSTAIPIENSERIFTFENLENLKYSNTFPSANLGALSQSGTESFYRITEDSVLFIGIQINENSILRYGKERLIIHSPLTFGETFLAETEYTQYEMEQVIATINYTEKVSFSGIGKVITPEREFENCYLIKKERVYLNNVNPNQTSYTFYNGGLVNSVASMLIEEGEAKSFSWQKNFDTSTSINNIEDLDMQISIQSNNQMNIKTDHKSDIIIKTFDIIGRELYHKEEIIYPGNNIIYLPNRNNDIPIVLSVINKKTKEITSVKIY